MVEHQMPEDLEIFDKRTAPVVETPQITIQANGNFSMNRPAFEALGEPPGLEYLYSPKTSMLGFRAADPNMPHAYRVRQQQNSLNYQFAGVAFHTHYGLPTGTARRYRGKMISDTLFVNLKDSAQDVTHRRKKGAGHGDDNAAPRG